MAHILLTGKKLTPRTDDRTNNWSWSPETRTLLEYISSFFEAMLTDEWLIIWSYTEDHMTRTAFLVSFFFLTITEDVPVTNKTQSKINLLSKHRYCFSLLLSFPLATFQMFPLSEVLWRSWRGGLIFFFDLFSIIKVFYSLKKPYTVHYLQSLHVLSGCPQINWRNQAKFFQRNIWNETKSNNQEQGLGFSGHSIFVLQYYPPASG